MKRTFIAVKIPINNKVQGFISESVKLLRNENIKWVNTINFHITLFFLGDTEENTIKKIEKDLTTISKKHKKNTIILKGAGTFKKGRFPKVIWIDTRIENKLVSLQNEITQILSNYGYENDQKEFIPHLTIGRIKFINNISALNNHIEKYNETEFDQIEIDKFIFYESILTSRGPEYRIIKEFYLQ